MWAMGSVEWGTRIADGWASPAPRPPPPTPVLRRGQSTLEYAVLVGIVAAALVAMHSYVQRAVQANLKTIQDGLSSTEPLE